MSSPHPQPGCGPGTGSGGNRFAKRGLRRVLQLAPRRDVRCLPPHRCVRPHRIDLVLPILAAALWKPLPSGLDIVLVEPPLSVHQRFAHNLSRRGKLFGDHSQLDVRFRGRPAFGFITSIGTAVEMVDHVHCGEIPMVGPSLFPRAADLIDAIGRFTQRLAQPADGHLDAVPGGGVEPPQDELEGGRRQVRQRGAKRVDGGGG